MKNYRFEKNVSAWRVFFICTVILAASAVSSAQKWVPIDPNLYKTSPKQLAQEVDKRCPIKDEWTVLFKKTGTFIKGSEFKQQSNDGRYCTSEQDQQQCQKYNPTPKAACKLIDPFLNAGAVRAQLCPVTFSDFILNKNVDMTVLGDWLGTNKSTSLYMTIYTCSRKYAMPSCRYHFQNAAITVYKDIEGIFTINKSTVGQLSGCQLDEAAETAFQVEVKKARPALDGLLAIKKTIYENKCANRGEKCKKQVGYIWEKSAWEAHGRFETFEANPGETMKYIAKIYDPLIEAEVNKYPVLSNFPK